MKNLKSILTTLALGASLVACAQNQPIKAVSEQLAEAKEKQQTVFLVVTDAKTSAEKIIAIAKEVAQEAGQVAVVGMNVDDQANVALVEQYRLSGAPMPLVLLLSNSGAVMGGLVEEQVTKEALTDAVPTPKYSEIIAALGQGKPVFVKVSNGDFTSDKDAQMLCEAAKNELQGAADVVLVDPKDTKESKLIEMLNIKGELSDTYIVVINSQGMMSGRFDKLPSRNDLVDAAKAIASGACAPGGCTPTC